MFIIEILLMAFLIYIIYGIIFKKPQKRIIIPEKQAIQSIKIIYDHKTLPHCLFYGPAGIGKTTLARAIANDLSGIYERHVSLHAYTPSVLADTDSVFELISKIQYGDVVFIDEIHGLPIDIEESLYGIMQDFTYFYGGQVISIPKFTLLGATTLAGKINKPLRDRFTIAIELDDMSEQELAQVAVLSDPPTHIKDYIGQEKVKQLIGLHVFSIGKQDVLDLNEEVINEIAKRSFGNPRIFKQIKMHVLAYQRLLGEPIDRIRLMEIFDLLSIDKNGLHKPDRRVLYCLLNSGRPLGASVLAEQANISREDLEEMVEPRLQKLGLIVKTGRGRIISERGKQEYGQ